MLDDKLHPYTPAAFALLADVPAAGRKAFMATLLDSIEQAMQNTAVYTTTDVTRHPLTLAAALLIVAHDELPPERWLPVLGRVMVWVGDSWATVASLGVPPDVRGVVGSAEAQLPLLPDSGAEPGPAPQQKVDEALLPRLIAPLPPLNFKTLPQGSRLRRNPFTVEVEAIPFRGARPKWWHDLLELSGLVLVQDPVELAVPVVRAPARIAAAALAVAMLDQMLATVDDATSVGDLKRWIVGWKAGVSESAIGAAVNQYVAEALAAPPPRAPRGSK